MDRIFKYSLVSGSPYFPTNILRKRNPCFGEIRFLIKRSLVIVFPVGEEVFPISWKNKIKMNFFKGYAPGLINKGAF